MSAFGPTALSPTAASYGNPLRRATFPCPLCPEVGRVVPLVAEFEPEPPLMIVVDLQGRLRGRGGIRRDGGADARGSVAADRGGAGRERAADHAGADSKAIALRPQAHRPHQEPTR